jgi:hypothetical protein
MRSKKAPTDQSEAVAAAYRLFERKAAEVLDQRISFDRAVDAREISDFAGYKDARYVYEQAAGEAALQYRVIFDLAARDAEGARRIRQLEAEAFGEELRPAARILAQAPTLREALRAVTESAICCSESTALEYAALRDERLTDEEMVTLEAQWAEEDRRREMRRLTLRTMHKRGSRPDGQAGRMLSEVERLRSKA